MRTRNSLRGGLLFDDFLFGTKQLKTKSEDRIGKSILQNQCFYFKFGITEDKCIFLILQEKPKRNTSGYPHVVAK